VLFGAWLVRLETRRRKPAKPATINTFRSYIRAHIGAIGEREIATFGNAQMRDFVAHLSEKKLASKTIMEVSNAVRQIISSVVDAEGDEVFPRKWNSEFIDAPIVEKQHTPTVTSADIERAIAKASEVDAAWPHSRSCRAIRASYDSVRGAVGSIGRSRPNLDFGLGLDSDGRDSGPYRWLVERFWFTPKTIHRASSRVSVLSHSGISVLLKQLLRRSVS
jgi:hypothetical protein